MRNHPSQRLTAVLVIAAALLLTAASGAQGPTPNAVPSNVAYRGPGAGLVNTMGRVGATGSPDGVEIDARGEVVPPTANPFDRPVGEEITQELIQATDLTGEGTSLINQIFDSEEHIERLLGTNPAFIYSTPDMRDPMIIPWIRREFDRHNLIELARAAERSGNFPAALEHYRDIYDQYYGSPEAGEAEQAIGRIEAMLQGVNSAAIQATAQSQVTLPHEIRLGLRGILFEPTNANCLIGDSIYGEGDVIPNYDVRIVEIRQEAVVFEYLNQEFTVPVAVN
ncbi:hypothetical protein JXA47_12130 [Candidatus Sumerlaeota bacterium]|nr:hypothetical protein [Candidatus Sumerlaeota bacterium]